MSGLAEFLLARIAEDERAAREAIADDNESDEGFAEQFDWLTGRAGRALGVVPRFGDAAARLITRFAVPARVLAECEARRRLVTEFGSHCGGYYAPGTPERAEDEQIAADIGVDYRPHWPEQYAPFCDGCAAAQSADHDHARVLRILAAVYSDHPDFDPSWRV